MNSINLQSDHNQEAAKRILANSSYGFPAKPIMTNQQWYAVRINTKAILPHELGEVISIWDNYSDASEDCEKRFKAGQKGVHVTTYENISQSPTN